MNRRVLIIVSCAFVMSIFASLLVCRVAGIRFTSGKPQKVAQVVVAGRDLPLGTVVRNADLKTAAWQGPLPKGAIQSLDVSLNRGVASPIYEGEPLTESRLAPKGSGGGLAATIPAGMRACAVKVNEVVGVAGFVVPGMRVDVLITGIPPGGSTFSGAKVRTLLQNIQVLSAGINFQKDQEGKPEQAQVVNLLVTPTDAEILSLASNATSNETHIQLVLRNPMDIQVSTPPGTFMSDLFGSGHVTSDRPARWPKPSPPAAIVVPPATHFYVIEVSNGSVHTQAKFSQSQGQN